jgi:hypothetical protein
MSEQETPRRRIPWNSRGEPILSNPDDTSKKEEKEDAKNSSPIHKQHSN